MSAENRKDRDEKRPEPPVAECRTCGKVFDAVGPVPRCPECDSLDVEILS